MRHLEGDRYQLSTGREVTAGWDGFIGLSPDMRVGFGCDSVPRALNPDLVDPEDAWTAAEKMELADFMIAQWQAYKAKWQAKDETR